MRVYIIILIIIKQEISMNRDSDKEVRIKDNFLSVIYWQLEKMGVLSNHSKHIMYMWIAKIKNISKWGQKNYEQ